MTAPEQVHAADELVAAWEEALDVLERDARAAAELVKDPRHDGAALTPWTPPTPAGPVPGVLVDRVRELLRLQAAVRVDLDRALDDTRTSLTGLHRTTTSARPGAAAYVDVSA
ncbi:hypothetical protein [Nocardioides sp.]|uniref:hypothetical protein n=1 Tax=Nocardioides sp. TaxID=35761 RepID=UPI0035AEC1DE